MTGVRSSTSLRGAAILLLALAACASPSSDAACAGGSCCAAKPARELPPVAPPIALAGKGYELAGAVKLEARKPEELPGIHNVFKLSDHIWSGSEPESDAAFAKLAAMGVKTIVSVDGKAPDVAMATKHGLRYVHVPIEYKGLSDEEVLLLAKAFRECEGPFFAHCFHGKHRGPAAAEIGRLVLDGIARETALGEMRQYCGTAPEYEGLFHDVATRAIPSPERTAAFVWDFPSSRGFAGFKEVMIDLSRREDALKKLEKRDWAPDPSHPDVDAANAATQVAQALDSASKLAEVFDRPADFHAWLKQAVAQSQEFAGQVAKARGGDADALAASRKSWTALKQACSDCHAKYRNQ